MSSEQLVPVVLSGAAIGFAACGAFTFALAVVIAAATAWCVAHAAIERTTE